MKKLLAIPLFVLCLVSAALAQAAPGVVALAWTAPTNGAYPLSAFSGYNLYVSTVPGTNTFNVATNFVANPMSMTVNASVGNLTRGTTYYFCVTSVGTNGLQSAYSLQVVMLIGEGLCLKEIGQRLGIARQTVEWHWRIAREKYGLRNYSEAVRWAIKKGFVQL